MASYTDRPIVAHTTGAVLRRCCIAKMHTTRGLYGASTVRVPCGHRIIPGWRAFSLCGTCERHLRCCRQRWPGQHERPRCDQEHRIVTILVVGARAIAHNGDLRRGCRHRDRGCTSRNANTPAHAITNCVARTHTVKTKTRMNKKVPKAIERRVRQRRNMQSR